MNNKLLIISSRTRPSIGGVETVVDLLSNGLSDKGLDVYVMTNLYRHKSIMSFIKYIIQNPIAVFKSTLGLGSNRISEKYKIVENYMIFWGISPIRSLLSILFFIPSLILFLIQILTINPGIINLHFVDNSAVYGIIFKILFPNKKMILSFHGSDINKFPKESNIQLRLVRIILGLADNVVVVSKYLRDSIVELYSNVEDKITIIPNGISDFWLNHDNVSSIPKSSKPYILYVGRLEKNKGVDILINAFPRLSTKDYILNIVGDGGESENLKILISELGLKDRVMFLGSRNKEELKSLYRNSEFVVIPSRTEAFGIVALEAMASNALVIGSTAGGLKDLVIDGQTGFTFKVDSVESLVKKIEIVLNNENINKQITQNARDFVYKNYRQINVINRYFDLIK